MNGNTDNEIKPPVTSDPVIPVSVTLPKSLIERADVRAKSMDMTRSQYFRKLAREDLAIAETKPLAA